MFVYTLIAVVTTLIAGLLGWLFGYWSAALPFALVASYYAGELLSQSPRPVNSLKRSLGWISLLKAVALSTVAFATSPEPPPGHDEAVIVAWAAYLFIALTTFAVSWHNRVSQSKRRDYILI